MDGRQMAMAWESLQTEVAGLLASNNPFVREVAGAMNREMERIENDVRALTYESKKAVEKAAQNEGIHCAESSG